jgi:hypothetical protein
MWTSKKSQIKVQCDQNYHYNSLATQISYDAGLVPEIYSAIGG